MFTERAYARFHQVRFHTGSIYGHPAKGPSSLTSRLGDLWSGATEFEPERMVASLMKSVRYTHQPNELRTDVPTAREYLMVGKRGAQTREDEVRR